MGNEKKKKNKFILAIKYLFILFLLCYIIGETGYYENSLINKTVVTESKIKEFEQDVLNGDVVDIKKYLDNEEVDYSNSFTNFSERLNSAVHMVFSDGAKQILSFVTLLFK